ncbi:hypothetical protein [Streptomyces sp. SID1121]|uniref:hypothetical protein n=1 Tax=Streptomyces sp. SID1121 TaxID=3425888 RepID=UPI0040559DAE
MSPLGLPGGGEGGAQPGLLVDRREPGERHEAERHGGGEGQPETSRRLKMGVTRGPSAAGCDTADAT